MKNTLTMATIEQLLVAFIATLVALQNIRPIFAFDYNVSGTRIC